MNEHLSLKVKFNKDFNKVNNSEFVEGTALIAYSGDNRNSSDITDEAFVEATDSLGLIPLVGHWLPEKQNFGGHDSTIEFVGSQLVLKDNTVPYGVVKENHNAEQVEIEENGVIHKYIKADVVLWYGRYPEPVQKVIDTGVNQSMEINVKSYSEKENGNIKINSFEYSALCLLGLDIDENGNKGEDNVEPCFEGASVVVDKFTINNKFKEQFTEMIKELNFQKNQSSSKEVNDMNISNKGGITILEEKIALLKKYNLTIESLSFKIDELSMEDLEAKISEHFALLSSQKREELSNALRTEKYKDRWNDEYSRYSYVDDKDNMVFAYDRQENWNLYGFTYSTIEDKVVIDFDSKSRKKFDIVDFVEGESATFNLFPQEALDYALTDKEKEIGQQSNTEEFEVLKTKVGELEITNTTLTEQFNTINTELETLKTENTSLSEFKAKIETAQQEQFELQQKQLKTELIENFSKVLTTEEIKSVTDKDLSIEDMETQFKLIYADKDLSTKFTKKSKKTETEIPISFNFKKKDDWTSCIKKQ